MCRYCKLFEGLAFLGDNTAALQLAISDRAQGEMGALARELFLWRTRCDWKYSVGHLPSEHNTIADALSRLHEPGHACQFPEALTGCAEVQPITLANLWSK